MNKEENILRKTQFNRRDLDLELWVKINIKKDDVLVTTRLWSGIDSYFPGFRMDKNSIASIWKDFVILGWGDFHLQSV